MNEEMDEEARRAIELNAIEGKILKELAKVDVSRRIPIIRAVAEFLNIDLRADLD